MYDVSNDYKNAITKSMIEDYVVGTITLANNTIISITDNKIKELRYDNQCVPDDGFDIGLSYTGEQELTIFDDISTENVFKAAKIELVYYLRTSELTYESVPLGVFKVIDCERIDEETIRLTAHDNRTKLDVPYPLNDESIEKKPFARLKDLCIACSMELWDADENVRAKIEDMPNGDISHTIIFAPEIVTARDYIDYICQLLCAFATIDRNGKLKIVCWKHIGLSTAYSIPDNLRKSTTFADTKFAYNQMNTFLTYFESENSITKTVLAPITPTTTGDVLFARSNPIVRFTLWDNAQTILNNTAAVLTNINPANGAVMSWYPCEVDYTGDPALDLGDWVTYTGYTAGTGLTVPIHKIDWTYRGYQKLTTVDGIKNNSEVNNERSAYGSTAQAQTTVVDNLLSTSATSALSANQGRILNDTIGDINTILASVVGG